MKMARPALGEQRAGLGEQENAPARETLPCPENIRPPSRRRKTPTPLSIKSGAWLRRPLNAAERDFLTEHCGGEPYFGSKPMRFDRRWRQRIGLPQPDTAALQFLAQRDGVLLNYLEIALDLIFRSEVDRDDAFDFVDRHHVKKYHRDRVRFVKGTTRYTDRRGAPNNLVTYSGRHSKLTGEVACLHFDWRITGAVALRRAGIESVTDLLTLDHHRFWQSRLLFYELDWQKLGLMLLNRQHGRRRRHWERAERAGSAIWLGYASVQRIINDFSHLVPVSKCLIPITNNPLFSARILYNRYRQVYHVLVSPMISSNLPIALDCHSPLQNQTPISAPVASYD